MTRGGVPFIELETGEGDAGQQSHRARLWEIKWALRTNAGPADRTRWRCWNVLSPANCTLICYTADSLNHRP